MYEGESLQKKKKGGKEQELRTNSSYERTTNGRYRVHAFLGALRFGSLPAKLTGRAGGWVGALQDANCSAEAEPLFVAL
jgi:hypothetical protein